MTSLGKTYKIRKILCKSGSRITCQNIQWELRNTRGSLDSQGKLADNVRQDLKDMGTTWDEAKKLATNRAKWRQHVTLDAR